MPTLTSATLAAWHIGVSVGVSLVVLVPDRSVTLVPEGAVPVTVAWLLNTPASISCWVIV